MDRQIERARDLLPSIVITVLSMIQALALELYWNRFQASDFLWQGGLTATLGWLQLLAMLMGILLVWLMYVSLVLRFRWMPTMEDTIIPFAIGLLEFSMIDLMGPATLGPWFMVQAIIFGLCTGASHIAFRRARQDPENAYFFRHAPPATWRDYSISAALVVILALFGVALWLLEDGRVLGIVAMLFTLGALSYQFLLSHRYWMNTVIDLAASSNQDSTQTGN